MFKKNKLNDQAGVESTPAAEKTAAEKTAAGKPAKVIDPERREKLAKRRRVNRLLDRIFGFLLVTVIVAGCTGLGVEFVIIKGPSPALKDSFTMTMLETRRFGFIPNIFLSQAEIDEIKAANTVMVDASDLDTSLINLPSDGESVVDETGADSFGLVDDDGDGLILQEVKGSGYAGYMLVVLDPSRVFVGATYFESGTGLTLDQIVDRYDAVGGINGGGFANSGSFGSKPNGLTIIEGIRYNYGGDSFCGLDSNHTLHVGTMTDVEAYDVDIIDGLTFGPVLVMNGQPVSSDTFESGVNPRTAIGQRSDGAILMLVIDGRQLHSVGAKYQDLVDIMMDYGAVNACNMDGGSSTSMYLNGEYVNSPVSKMGPSTLPTAWIIK